MNAQTLKGFRDFLPEEATKRRYVIDKITEAFKLYGFEPLETPALEYEEVLTGKYGEEGEKLMYRFTDNGDRRVAMRYDQTVPLARVIAQYPELPKPFKRYQMQNVWRAENTQKGRFREFLQCDVDTIGSASPLADAEIILAATTALKNLNIKNFKVLINDRNIFNNLVTIQAAKEENLTDIIRSIDKLKKIGREGVIEELISKGFNNEQSTFILQKVEEASPTEQLKQILEILSKSGLEASNYQFMPTLARGLDYYTSTIFEIEIEGYTAGSVAGGGRYDKLIGLYSGQDQPAVGLAFGFDRLMEALEQFELLPTNNSSAKVLVTIFSPEILDKSIEVTNFLRGAGINSEIYLDANSKLDKQFKYADNKKIPFVVIIGPDEANNNTVTLKNFSNKTQVTITLDELAQKLTQ
jgi:histidyl-tRNA synthetase